MTHADQKINTMSAVAMPTLAGIEANGSLNMLNRKVVLTSPQSKLAAQEPAKSKVRVQMQGTINQRYVHCNVLPEYTERNCSVGNDKWIVPGDTQCPSCELDALLLGRLQIVRPTTCVDIGMATGGHRKRRPVIRVPLQRPLGQLKRTPGPFSTH